jgi:hypothetical protein
MSDLKEQRLSEVSKQYPGIPPHILAPAVDAAGLVDTQTMSALITAFQAGVSGKVAAQDAQNAAQLQKLTTTYAEAKTRNDGVMMVSLVRQIHALGGAV